MKKLSENTITCYCKTCVDHRHEIKDYHPEIPWKDSKDIEKRLRRDMEKTWGKEQATIRWNKGLRE